MKKLFKSALLIAALSFLSCGAFAETSFNSKWDKHDWKKEGKRGFLDYKHGPTSYENKTLKNLLVKGPTKIRSVHVSGDTEIHGPLNSRGSDLESAEVHGPVLLIESNVHGEVKVHGPIKSYGTTFDGEVTIHGPLTTEESVFNGTLKLSAKNVTLESSKTKDIIMKSKSQKDKVLTLANNTSVDGSIVFENSSSKNKVIIEKGSNVSGSITGAEVVRKS